MKVLYLSTDFGVRPCGSSGASVHVRETVTALRGLGHEVLTVSPNEGADRVLPLGGAGEEALRLMEREGAGLPDHLPREWRRLLYAEYAQRPLLALLNEHPPDFIYERYSLFSYAGVQVACEAGVPLVLEVNAPLSEEGAKYRDLVLRTTARELERRIFCDADALVVVSGLLAEHARALGVENERITVLPNGVDPERFQPDVSGAPVRERHGLGDAWVAGFAGSFKPWHDLDTLVAAVRSLAQDGLDVRLLAVGDGPRLRELAPSGEPFLVCTGAVDYAQMPAHLAAMDAIVVPYAADGDRYFSPLKLYEAMAMARPVVGARTGQVAETITDGETGLLYEPGSRRALADTLRKLAALPDRGASLGERARRWVLDGRTWEANARRIVAIGEGLIAGRRRAS
jgi:glycosyltransferase involved in cell wall biosynthesis